MALSLRATGCQRTAAFLGLGTSASDHARGVALHRIGPLARSEHSGQEAAAPAEGAPAARGLNSDFALLKKSIGRLIWLPVPPAQADALARAPSAAAAVGTDDGGDDPLDLMARSRSSQEPSSDKPRRA